MLKRAFRNVAVIAGLIQRNHPGAEKSRRQVTVNSDLIYDVLRRHQPDHILLRATRADAASGLIDVGRIAGMLARVKGQIVHMVLSRVSPLAVPVLLEIGRESVRTDSDEDALLAEAEAIIAEATGERRPAACAGDPPANQARPPPGRRMTLRSAPGRPPAQSRLVLVTAAPIHIAGERLMLDPMGALFWPAAAPARGVRSSPGERLLVCSARNAAAALGYPCDARPDDVAASSLVASDGRRAGGLVPRCAGVRPAAGDRVASAQRDDRGTPFHLGAGQP